MKRIIAAVTALVLVTVCASTASAQLINGNLNTASISSQVLATPTGWTVTASRTISGVFDDGASSEGFANNPVADPGGAFGLFFKPFQGNAIDGRVTVNLFQDRPALAGLSYTLSAWAGAGTGYVGLFATNGTQSLLALDFLDGASSVIGGSVLNLGAAGLGTPNGNPFNYAQYSVSALAPVGTVGVRVRASMVDAFSNPAGGDQAFVVDAFVLTVPEPTTFALVGLGFVALVGIRRLKQSIV